MSEANEGFKLVKASSVLDLIALNDSFLVCVIPALRHAQDKLQPVPRCIESPGFWVALVQLARNDSVFLAYFGSKTFAYINKSIRGSSQVTI